MGGPPSSPYGTMWRTPWCSREAWAPGPTQPMHGSTCLDLSFRLSKTGALNNRIFKMSPIEHLFTDRHTHTHTQNVHTYRMCTCFTKFGGILSFGESTCAYIKGPEKSCREKNKFKSLSRAFKKSFALEWLPSAIFFPVYSSVTVLYLQTTL